MIGLGSHLASSEWQKNIDCLLAVRFAFRICLL